MASTIRGLILYWRAFSRRPLSEAYYAGVAEEDFLVTDPLSPRFMPPFVVRKSTE